MTAFVRSVGDAIVDGIANWELGNVSRGRCEWFLLYASANGRWPRHFLRVFLLLLVLGYREGVNIII